MSDYWFNGRYSPSLWNIRPVVYPVNWKGWALIVGTAATLYLISRFFGLLEDEPQRGLKLALGIFADLVVCIAAFTAVILKLDPEAEVIPWWER